ncbi:hypothetical protein [Sphingomonas mucosissima]|uniref:hypothetical protein n=1 Tax=Sphingomonas mucosissima TaxID=370959 RepID=UPI001124E367|nr:hypothetical protein [Sphingomonas mucosissima]
MLPLTLAAAAPALAEAQVEALGDLKLYRVPMRVNVAAQAQKQVAMLVQPAASFERVYLLDAAGAVLTGRTVRPTPFELRARNVETQGLGVPLPAGTVALFARRAGRELLAGEAPIDDLAVGEKISLPFGESPDVTWTRTLVAQSERGEQWRIDSNSARTTAVKAELTLPFGIKGTPAGAHRSERGWILPFDLPANEARSFTYFAEK